jgi:hypothetical protein
MFQMRLRNAGRTRGVQVREQGGRWEVSTEEDSRIVRSVRYDDWHRVERAVMAFKLEVSALEQQYLDESPPWHGSFAQVSCG